jgi:hypothetical protein
VKKFVTDFLFGLAFGMGFTLAAAALRLVVGFLNKA